MHPVPVAIRYHRRPMDDPARILLIRPSALGDVCRTVPVLATLRAAFPRARIDWLVQDSFAAAIERHPALSCAIPFPRRRFGRPLSSGSLAAFFEWSGCLADVGYDLVVDAQGLARSGLLAFLTGAGVRLGYANAQELAALFYTRRVHVPRERHAVDRMLGLVSEGLGIPAVPDMRLYTDPAARDQVGSFEPLAGRRFILIAPTSRWPAKRWSAQRFAALTDALLSSPAAMRLASAVVLVGGPGERDQCAPLLDLAGRDERIIDLVGATPVSLLMALVEAARLVVANDSAALHMAVGLGRPTVALFGPTDVSRVGPFQREADVIQHLRTGDILDHKSPASACLMDRISVDEVLSACLQRLRPAADDGGVYPRFQGRNIP